MDAIPGARLAPVQDLHRRAPPVTEGTMPVPWHSIETGVFPD